MKIFLIEDDIQIGNALFSVLKDEGHVVVWCRLGADAVERVRTEYFDLLLLDLGLPDANGVDILAALRDGGHTLPVLVITARESLQDRLGAFATGADDYLIKPFAIPELLARLGAIARRVGLTHDGREPEWKVGTLVLSERRKAVTLAGEPVALSKTEYALLLTLLQQAGSVLTRTEIENRVLRTSEGKTLDVHIFNLRKKIGDGFIRTVRGVGYLVESDAV